MRQKRKGERKVQLSNNLKKLMKMRLDGESNEDVAEYLGLTLGDVAELFVDLEQQIKTIDDSTELMNIIKAMPTIHTEKRSKRLLDDIPMDHLINYILKNFSDETWEALAEDRHG